METNYSVTNVSTENPLLGIANCVARQQNLSKEGKTLPAADKVQTAWEKTSNPQALSDPQNPKG